MGSYSVNNVPPVPIMRDSARHHTKVMLESTSLCLLIFWKEVDGQPMSATTDIRRRVNIFCQPLRIFSPFGELDIFRQPQT